MDTNARKLLLLFALSLLYSCSKVSVIKCVAADRQTEVVYNSGWAKLYIITRHRVILVYFSGLHTFILHRGIRSLLYDHCNVGTPPVTARPAALISDLRF